MYIWTDATPLQITMSIFLVLFVVWTVLVVNDGNDYQRVWKALTHARSYIELGPIAVLLQTTKGLGIKEFEGQPQSHAGPPLDYETALNDLKTHIPNAKTTVTDEEAGVFLKRRHPFCEILGSVIKEVLDENPLTVVLGVDTLDDHNLVADGRRIIDCGIAEQNAVSMASALALDGYKPIVLTYARS